MSNDIIAFFNQISGKYDDLIARSVPRYREMFWAMLYYLPETFTPRNILELGCGTGNLTRLLHERWPESQISVVDFSPEMLQMTSEKLVTAHLHPIESDFESLTLPPAQFDLVISSIAVHHILDEAKATLIQNIHTWLTPGGFFVLGDQVHSASERLYEADLQFYEAYAQVNGASFEDVLNWRAHRNTQDHYATLENLTTWMKTAGFEAVDTLWRYCFWAVLQGQKAR
jgi:tRNA (cmo5U34)-methyltransferase